MDKYRFSNHAVIAKAGEHQLIKLIDSDIALLQTLYDQNPEYSKLVMGRLPLADEAHTDFFDLPPPEFSMTEKTMVGLVSTNNELIGVADIVSDFIAKNVWHIGYFMIATKHHGTGAARQFYAALETWMTANGARWLRLGVVAKNIRGKKFWQNAGFSQVRTRENYVLGEKSHLLYVMAKPLGENNLDAYLRCVLRDNPE